MRLLALLGFAAFLLLPPTRLDQWLDAVGGPNVWDRVHTLEYTITTVWFDSAGVEVRRRPRQVWIRKDPGAYRVRVERKEAAGQYVQVWDGRTAWATLDGRRLADSALAVREAQYVAGDLTYWIALPWKLRDPGVNLTWPEPDVLYVTFGGGVGLHDGDRYWYFWQTESPFPTAIEYIEQGKTENDRTRIVLSEWKKIGPAVIATNRRRVNRSGATTHLFVITGVKVNQPMNDSLFSGS